MEKTYNNLTKTSWFENIKLFKFKKALKSESVFELENIHVIISVILKRLLISKDSLCFLEE